MTRPDSGSRTLNVQGGRLFKFKGKIVSAAPSALLASVSAVALTLTSVHADEISTVLTTPQTFATDVDHSISATGAINITDSSTAALTIDTDYSSTFTNDGTISLMGDASDVTGLYLDGDLLAGGVINNNGTININVEYDTPEVYGINVDGEVAGTVNNTGTISAYALGTDDEASVWGIYIAGEVSATGQILNSGTITAKAEQTDNYTAVATGIEVEGELNGLISNSGTISATAISTESYATAYGINVDGQAGATARILNTGTITVMATTTSDSSALAYGIQVDGNFAGMIENSGSITVSATAGDYYAESYGILVDGNGDATSSVLNSGIITVKTTTIEDSTAEAYGIQVDGNMAGVINNTGTIDVFATAQSDYYAYAYGIQVDGDLTGSILNSGTIKVVADSGTDTATAVGINVDDDVVAGATIVNSGTITVTARGTESYVYASGIYLEDNVAGDVTNSGTITAISTGAAGASTATASGFYIGDDLSGSLTNSGTITTTATSNDDEASSWGVYVGGDTSGTVTNSGMITATATVSGGTDDAQAYGFELDDMTGTFANSGTITAAATNAGTGDAEAYGLYVDDMNGEITDLGTITVSAADEAYAVYLDGGTGTMNVNTDDNVAGLMRVSDHNVDLLSSGQSNMFRFEDANTGAGTFTTSVSDNTSAWFVLDEGGTMPIYQAVNTGDLNISANVVAGLAGQLDGFSDQLNASSGVSRNSKALSFLQGSGAMGGLRPFASVGGQHSSFDTTGTSPQTNVNIGNAMVGMSGTMGNGMDLAFGLGVLTADGNSGMTQFDVSGYYLGGSVGTRLGGFDVDAGLGFGMLDTEKTRTLTATDSAVASFDSNFVTVHVGAQREFQLGAGFDVTGFGQLRYTSQNDDGYTEVATTGGATVGDRTTEVTEATLGVEAVRTLSDGGLLTGHVTAISRTVSGDDFTSVSVFGTTANIASSDADYTGVNVGIGYEKELASNATLNLSVDHDLGDNGSGPNLSAGLSWSF